MLPTGSPNCRWLNLPSNGAYTCSTAAHVLTHEDIARGWFIPTVTCSFTSRPIRR